MGITRAILNKMDEKFNGIDENTKHPLLKSFGCGFVEGMLDGAVIAYPILVTACILAGKALKNKED